MEYVKLLNYIKNIYDIEIEVNTFEDVVKEINKEIDFANSELKRIKGKEITNYTEYKNTQNQLYGCESNIEFYSEVPEEPIEFKPQGTMIKAISTFLIGIILIVFSIIMCINEVILGFLIVFSGGTFFLWGAYYCIILEPSECKKKYLEQKKKYEIKIKEYKKEYKKELKKEKLRKLKLEKELEKIYASLLIKKDSKIKEQEEKLKKLRIIKNEFEKRLISNKNKLKRLYEKNIVFPKYHNLIAISNFYEYLKSKRTESLEGENGAYNLYEKDGNKLDSYYYKESLIKIQKNKLDCKNMINK